MGEVVCTVIVGDKKSDLVLPDHIPAHLLTGSISSALKFRLNENQPVELYKVTLDGDQLIRGSRTLAKSRVVNGDYLKLVFQADHLQKRGYLYATGGQRFTLYEHNRIGRVSRTAEVDIDLDSMDYNSVVSRNHAMIEIRDGHYWISDLESKNGTFVNGRRIYKTPVSLKPNDEVCFGSEKRGVKMVFVMA